MNKEIKNKNKARSLFSGISVLEQWKWCLLLVVLGFVLTHIGTLLLSPFQLPFALTATFGFSGMWILFFSINGNSQNVVEFGKNYGLPYSSIGHVLAFVGLFENFILDLTFGTLSALTAIAAGLVAYHRKKQTK